MKNLWKFTDREFNRVCRAVLEDLKGEQGVEPVSSPFAVILGGQPGSGKTTLHRIFKSANPNITIINGDDLRL